MAQAINELLNINITKAAGLPDTGFAGPVNNVGDVVNDFGIVSCSLIAVALIALAIATILFLTRRVFDRPNLALISSLGVFTFALGLAFPAICLIAHAVDTHTTTFNITTGSAPVASTIDTEGITLAEAAPYGYKVTAYVDGDGTLTNGTSTINPTASSVASPDFLVTNTYAVKDSTGQYISISTDPANPTEILRSEEGSPAGTPITLTYAAKLDGTLEAGTYAGGIHYDVEALPVSFDVAYKLAGKSKITAQDGNQYYTMQDMNNAICASVASVDSTDVTKAQEGTLVDIRDGKTYTVAKLADDNCWMTQNLGYRLSSSQTLTPADSNVSTNFTPNAANNTIAKDDLVTDWAKDTFLPHSWDPEESENGVYYNWTAAVARNDTYDISSGPIEMPESVCPKGWRLPSGNISEPSEFGFMLFKQQIIGSSIDTTYIDDGGFGRVMSAPLNWKLSGGVITTGGVRREYFEDRGYYWSSTVVNTESAHYAQFKDSFIYPRASGARSFGVSIRCLSV